MGDNYPHTRHMLITKIENLKKEIDMEQQRADKNEDDYCKLGERLTKENGECIGRLKAKHHILMGKKDMEIETLKRKIDMEKQRADKNFDRAWELGERLTKENDELKKERHANFKEWMMMGLKLKAENDELKKKLNLTQD